MVFNNEPVSYDELLRLAELPSLFNRRLQEIAILNYVLRIVCAVFRDTVRAFSRHRGYSP